MSRFKRTTLAVAAVAAALTGCNAAKNVSVAEIQPSALPRERAVALPSPTVLAEGTVPSLPADHVEWVADRVAFWERPIVHRHEAAFVYAPVTPSRLVLPQGARTLAPGQAVFVPAGVWHTHDRTCSVPTDCRDAFVEIRMTSTDTPLPRVATPKASVFESSEIGVARGAPAQVRLELIRPDAVPEAGEEGGTLYVRVPRNGYALGWRVVQEDRGTRR